MTEFFKNRWTYVVLPPSTLGGVNVETRSFHDMLHEYILEITRMMLNMTHVYANFLSRYLHFVNICI